MAPRREAGCPVQEVARVRGCVSAAGHPGARASADSERCNLEAFVSERGPGEA